MSCDVEIVELKGYLWARLGQSDGHASLYCHSPQEPRELATQSWAA